MGYKIRRRGARQICLAVAAVGAVAASHSSNTIADPVWSNFAGDAQHTADSSVASDSLSTIRWSTPVDLDPTYTDGVLYIHYGSPVVTSDNTVIVPVKTDATGDFSVEALNGSNGSLIWSTPTNYTLPPAGWTPSYSPALTPNNTLYYAGPGGTVYYRNNLSSLTPTSSGQIAFYGNSNYTSNESAFNSDVMIDTPITSDSSGDIYFGYRVTNPTPLGSTFTSGIARIAANGTATYVAANMLGDPSVNSTVMNCAPALSPDGKTLYMTVSNVNPSTGQSTVAATGDLVALNSTTLAPINIVPLKDPTNGNSAWLPDDGSASPTVGPDGQVYIGVLATSFTENNDRGYMLQFNAGLTSEGTPGSFGWDDTASIVPASMVPSYKGTSKYLLMTKYNNYAGIGTGNGVNQIAILDPNSSTSVAINGASNPLSVMQEVETIDGVTPDQDAVNEGYLNAVKEWCINSAVVDPATDSVLVNSEDGDLYRWDLATNTFTQVIDLTSGIGEAYTPTLIGADGSVFAINDATLYNVVPEPASGTILLASAMVLSGMRRRPRSHRKLPKR